jgi:hypothetical protein
MERAEAAEAEVVTLRAKVAAVESLADEWADRKRSDGMSGNAWIGLTLSGVAADLRVALGDEPTEHTSPTRITEAGAVEYVSRAELQVKAVRAAHRRVTVSEEWGTEVECGHCCTIDGDPAPWPCVTIKAMDGVTL